MDIRIQDGDNVLRGGRFDSATGFDETAQQALIAIFGKRGAFIYDRELGSLLQDYLKSGESVALKQADSIVRSAVSRLENASAKVKSLVQKDGTYEITVEITEKHSGIQEERVIVI